MFNIFFISTRWTNLNYLAAVAIDNFILITLPSPDSRFASVIKKYHTRVECSQTSVLQTAMQFYNVNSDNSGAGRSIEILITL